jgi:hypothetical protein
MGSKLRLLRPAPACGRAVATVVALFALALFAQPAAATDRLVVGATEDMFKLEPALARSLAADLGLGAARISLHWDPWQTALKPSDARLLDNAVTTGVRIVLSVSGWHNTAPQDGPSREAYCAYVGNVLARYPEIHDVVIWNEPNISYFWTPQYDSSGASASPKAYAALLARCWDVLHALRPSVNVIAPATSPWGTDESANAPVISHSPITFIRELGAAYRATRRDRPLFDTVGHHVYGAFPGERPWRRHPARRISQGDLAKLVDVLQDAFAGTAQGVPGAPALARVAEIWYMEAGFETVPDEAKRPFYVNQETTAALPDSLGVPPWTTLPDANSPAPDQATQLRDAIRFAYCQPYVTAFFNFLLRDQSELNYWQSGVLWPDRTPKDSYGPFKDVVGEVNRRQVDCGPFAGVAPQGSPNGPPPPVDEGTVGAPGEFQKTNQPPSSVATARVAPRALAIQRVVWARRRTYAAGHVDWRIAVRVTRSARFRAVIAGRATPKAKGARRLVVSGQLVAGRVKNIRFPRRRLAAGAHRVTLTVVAPAPGPQALVRRSRVFRVARAAR